MIIMNAVYASCARTSADIMDMKLTRTKTIAEGADMCDFRYSRK